MQLVSGMLNLMHAMMPSFITVTQLILSQPKNFQPTLVLQKEGCLISVILVLIVGWLLKLFQCSVHFHFLTVSVTNWVSSLIT